MQDKNKIYFKSSLFAFMAIIFYLPALALAQSILITSDKDSYHVSENITVNFVLDTGEELINAMEGKIRFSEKLFSISGISTDNSCLSLWPEKPVAHGEDNEGKGDDENENKGIAFAGGVPNGFNGQNCNVFIMSMKAKKAGQSIIDIKNLKVLLNDGLATELQGVAINPLTLTILPKKEKDEGSQGQKTALKQVPVVQNSNKNSNSSKKMPSIVSAIKANKKSPNSQIENWIGDLMKNMAAAFAHPFINYPRK